jgi:hypothetical protein
MLATLTAAIDLLTAPVNSDDLKPTFRSGEIFTAAN